MEAAHEEWGCNCGPTSLAFALQVSLAAVRHAIPGFEEKKYTSPSMMKAGLAFFKRPYQAVGSPAYIKGRPIDVEPMFSQAVSLIRIQFTRPWTAPNANPKWAYRQTHWIAAWSERGVPLIFDCNGLILALSEWEENILPRLIESYPRADGEWFPTHIWRIRR